MERFHILEEGGISPARLRRAIDRLVEQYPGAGKVLILPPDYTRCFSYAGPITQLLYQRLTARGASVQVMPALGTHAPMTETERRAFFGDTVPDRDILIHHWQTDNAAVGKVPADFVEGISGGLYREEISVELNHLLLDGGYDLILSVGQVVPHEVVGMANYSKNLFVGVGGRDMINKSHFLGALCGMEKALGEIDPPARLLYDYAQREFVDGKLPVVFLLTVTTQDGADTHLNGLFVGEDRGTFEGAARLSQKLNIVHMARRPKKVVAYLDPAELKSTWVGGKGIYRTRMMIEDGGELLLLAPGVTSFGENPEMDALIRKYGYRGTPRVLELYRQGAFENATMCAAHLIHGSSEGRFTITWATRPENLSRAEVESVGYQWMDYDAAVRRYDPHALSDGWHTGPDGEEFYYVSRPTTGLWKWDGPGT